MKKIITIILTLVVVSIIAYFAFAQKKTTVARIDLTTGLVNKAVPQFEIYVDGSEEPQNQAAWMPKNNIQGYVVQKDGNAADIIVKSLADAQIKVFLRGPDVRDDNNKTIENWVKYTSFDINGQEVLPESMNVWHNKPFVYTVDAKKGDEYKIQIKWK